MTEGLADQFWPVKDPNGHQHMRRVGALAATHVEEAARAHLSEEGVEQQELSLPGDEPGPELAQHGMVEARLSQLEAERLFPVDAAAHRVSRLAVGEALGKLHDGREGKVPRRGGWLPTGRE